MSWIIRNPTNYPVNVKVTDPIEFPAEPLTVSVEDHPSVFVAHTETVSATGYMILVDKSDTDNFHHVNTGSINLLSTYLSVDKTNSATGTLALGIVTRVSATDADVVFFQGLSFSNASERTIIRDRNFFPSVIRCRVTAGNMASVVAPKTLNIAALNSATPIPTAAGTTAAPQVGDLIASWVVSAGNFTYNTSVFYDTEA